MDDQSTRTKALIHLFLVANMTDITVEHLLYHQIWIMVYVIKVEDIPLIYNGSRQYISLYRNYCVRLYPTLLAAPPSSSSIALNSEKLYQST